MNRQNMANFKPNTPIPTKAYVIITGTLILLYEYIAELWLDLWYWTLQRKPLWPDALPCHRRICRFCGGKYN